MRACLLSIVLLSSSFSIVIADNPSSATQEKKEKKTKVDPLAGMKAKIEAAAGMSFAAFEVIARSQSVPKLSEMPNQPLTVLALFAIRKAEGKAQAKEFNWNSPQPRPKDLAGEIARKVKSIGGFKIKPKTASLFQADRITKVTGKVDKDVLRGTFDIKVPKLFTASVNYTAKKTKKGFQLKEFSLPARQMIVRLDDKGLWKLHVKPKKRS